jgi:3,4-dehydroadipyl-CoA semialdehyde dehydrogenase
VASGSDTEQMFLRDVVRDITQKAGQKCTAIRRVYAPAERLSEIRDELVSRLRDVKVGNPAEESVTMGPLSTAAQLRDIREGIARLASEATYAIGEGPFDRIGVPADKGYFVPPTLFVQADPASAQAVDAHEVFGPVATLMPYADAAGVTSLVRRGGGGLVCSLYSDDRDLCAAVLEGIASSHGRLMMGSEKIADQAPGPGTVLPQMIHGGPGRAGGGEELGGAFGLAFYSQRTAVQGSRPILEAILGK